jgi:hypothetical protein
LDDISFGSDESDYDYYSQLEERYKYAQEEVQQLKLEVERLKDLLMV